MQSRTITVVEQEQRTALLFNGFVRFVNLTFTERRKNLQGILQGLGLGWRTVVLYKVFAVILLWPIFSRPLMVNNL